MRQMTVSRRRFLGLLPAALVAAKVAPALELLAAPEAAPHSVYKIARTELEDYSDLLWGIPYWHICDRTVYLGIERSCGSLIPSLPKGRDDES